MASTAGADPIPDGLPIQDFTSARRSGGDLKDPLNLAFVGVLADPDRVYEIITGDLGLRTDKGLSDQFFGEPANPVVSHRQDFNQSNHFISGFWSRRHARVYSAFEAHPVYGRFTAAAIHVDHWVLCSPIVNDAAESYDDARKWATKILRRRYGVAIKPLVTFSPIRQCNGDTTGTDGRYAIVGERDELVRMGLDLLTEDEP